MPLGILELYLRAQAGGGDVRRFATAGALVLLTLAMAAGIVMAVFGMWLSRM